MSTPVHLHGEGVSVLLAPSPSGAPTLLHWGAALGDLSAEDLAAYPLLRSPGVPHSALDHPRHLDVVPLTTSGFTGTPAVEGHRLAGDPAASAPAPSFTQWQMRHLSSPEPGIETTASDDEAGLELVWHLELTAEGLVRARTTVRNTGPAAYALTAVRTVLPVPAHATELLDLTGRWSAERRPQRHPWPHGTWRRTGRHGRSGHDATLLLTAGSPGFGSGHGDVWGVHVAWSGDHETYAERTPEGECLLGGGELLAAGEVVLEPGDAYTTPWLFGSHSGAGLDGMSDRLHRWVRRHSPRTRGPRPVVVNTWEATYFEHSLERLVALADAAADVGAERFVLDDGWFRGRRDDLSGLGDWTVDPDVWPQGLGPLVDHVRGLDMQFGLWVEPEMVNEDSDLARAHPDWVLRGRSALPPTWRHQQVLDLQHPDAYAHVRDALLRLLDEYAIDFLKWDHNRDLVEVAHGGRPAVHGQTTALHRLLDDLREVHPTLEIESCASGGGRIDLGVIPRTDRVWPSDSLDPLVRLQVQRWTSLLVPPEMVGAHVGGPVAHTTGRRARLGFRAAVALLGHFGIEWDLTTLDDWEREHLRSWVALYKEIRPLVGEGRRVHPDHPDPAVHVSGSVARDGSEAVYVVAVADLTLTQSPYPVRLTGLDADRRYRVRTAMPVTDAHPWDLAPTWTTGEEIETTGGLLERAGLRLPTTAPETAYVVRLSAVDGGRRSP